MYIHMRMGIGNHDFLYESQHFIHFLAETGFFFEINPQP